MSGFRIFAMVFWAAITITTAARADAIISGPACIVDGNVIQVGSKRKNGKCWGGIDIRIHGIKAPSLGETCTTTAGKNWNCGDLAKKTLAGLIKLGSITCYHVDGEFQGIVPIATCVSGHNDLAAKMIASGMAKAMPEHTSRYDKQELKAKSSRAGLWE